MTVALYQLAGWGQGMISVKIFCLKSSELPEHSQPSHPASNLTFLPLLLPGADGRFLCESRWEYFLVSLMRWLPSLSEYFWLLCTMIGLGILPYFWPFEWLVWFIAVVDMKWLSIFLVLCYISVYWHIKHLVFTFFSPHCFLLLHSWESRKEIPDLLRVKDYYSDFKWVCYP